MQGLFITLTLLCAALRAGAVADVSTFANCALFTTNGADSTTFTYHRFYDFRNQNSGQKRSSSAPSNVAHRVVTDSSWSQAWKARVQHRPAARNNTVPMQYASEGVSVGASKDDPSTYLTLSTSRLKDGTQQASEIDYQEFNVTYGSIRVLTRVQGDPGAVAGIFTYYNDTTELDIEMRTQDPSNYIHYANQPATDDAGAAIPGLSFNTSTPCSQKTSDWNIHRLDWTPQQSVWYVNGVEMASTAFNVPHTASMVILNMWSNGGPFSGRMAIGDSASLHVQWIQMVFNASTQPVVRAGIDRATRCSIDESSNHSQPTRRSQAVMLYQPNWELVILFISLLLYLLISQVPIL